MPFLVRASAGKVPLTIGRHSLAFRFEGKNEHHGSLDCLVFAPDSLQPMSEVEPTGAADRITLRPEAINYLISG